MGRQRGRQANAKKNISDYNINKNITKAHLHSRAPCWCQGFNVGCGKVLAYSTRKLHQRMQLEKSRHSTSEGGETNEEPMEDIDMGYESNHQALIYEEMAPEHLDQGYTARLDERNKKSGSNPARTAFIVEEKAVEVMGEVEASQDMSETTSTGEEVNIEGDRAIIWDQAEDDSFESEDELELHRLRIEEEMDLHFQQRSAELEQLSLRDQDLRQMRVLAYNLKYGHSRAALEELTEPDMMDIDTTPYRMKKQLEELSGLHEKIYHCCINSCILFAGEYLLRKTCPVCFEPRFDNRNKPRNIYRYLPIIPRLQALFKSDRMVQELDYRQRLGPFEGTFRDVFDSEHFRDLLARNVEVEGEKLPFKFGEFDTDIFLGLTTDGVALFRGLTTQQSRTSLTCWPVAVIIYSLSPTLRTQLQFTFSLGIIPGPHQPKIMNSFLFPFYEECLNGARGVETYHSGRRQMFQLHFYPIVNTMDILGAVKVRGGKSPGAIIPCHECRIEGINHPDPDVSNRHYYYPSQRPEDSESLTDDLLQNLNTHEYFVDIWDQLSRAKSDRDFIALQQKYGVTCVPIVGLLPSIDIVKSFPYGLMHQLFENLCPNMVNHWKGRFTQLSSTSDPYYIKSEVWKQINTDTRESARLTPSWMVRLMPDLTSSYTAESWAFWMTWMSPYLLFGRLPDEHYQHLLLMVRMIKLATSLEITEAMLEELDEVVREWHAEYERLYFRFDYDRLPACPLTIHALLHLANDTRNAGPLSRVWEFVTERIMGFIGRSVKSRRYPFSQISQTLKMMEQMKTVAIKFNRWDELKLERRRLNWNTLHRNEQMFPEINKTTILSAPRQDDYAWTDEHRSLVAQYFKAVLCLEAPVVEIVKQLPKLVTRWGSYRVKGEGNKVSSTFGLRTRSVDSRRDSSFVRTELLDSEDNQIVCYGQLQYIAHVSLRSKQQLQIQSGVSELIAIVRWCKDAVGDASQNPVWYTDMGAEEAINVATLQCGVGRIRIGERYGIIDLSYGCARMVFVDDDDDSEI
ncbi:hypothetical protein FRC17_005140 [Serendipita sp. 399]|nr:hypothetical protein FRC17_005140 [Serendipita sp. 399]